MVERYFDPVTGRIKLLNWVEVRRPRDSRWHREAAACEDMPVPQDCQARCEAIARTPSAIK